MAAAEKWLERPDVKADKNVARNMVRIAQYWPNGFLPYVAGVPVVARGASDPVSPAVTNGAIEHVDTPSHQQERLRAQLAHAML